MGLEPLPDRARVEAVAVRFLADRVVMYVDNSTPHVLGASQPERLWSPETVNLLAQLHKEMFNEMPSPTTLIWIVDALEMSAIPHHAPPAVPLGEDDRVAVA